VLWWTRESMHHYVSVSTCLSTGISVFRVKDARKPIKGNILRKTHLVLDLALVEMK